MNVLPKRIKIPKHDKNRHIVGQFLLIPQIAGISTVMAAFLHKIPVFWGMVGGGSLVLTMALMVVILEWDRLMIRPQIYHVNEGCLDCLFTIVSYGEDYYTKKNHDEMEWRQIKKIFPGVYFGVGEPFVDNDTLYRVRRRFKGK